MPPRPGHVVAGRCAILYALRACVAVRAKAVDNLMRHGFLGGQHLKTLAVFRLFTVRALYLSLYGIYTLLYKYTVVFHRRWPVRRTRSANTQQRQRGGAGQRAQPAAPQVPYVRSS